VKSDSTTPPNPYLSHVPNRDIVVDSTLKLTLVNPAYMSRQVYELSEETSDVRGHITSLNPIRPENNPDSWEEKVLNYFEQGGKEYFGVDSLHGKEYFRYMKPFVTEQSCLKCHEHQGYKVNDIRGGISISYPLEELNVFKTTKSNNLLVLLLVFWLLGLFIILVAYWRIKRSDSKRLLAESNLNDLNHELEFKVETRTEELQKSEKKLDIIFQTIPIAISLVDEKGILLDCNNSLLELHGYKNKEELVGKHTSILFPNFEHERAQKDIAQIIGGSTKHGLQYTLKRKDSSTFPTEISSSIFIDNSSGEKLLVSSAIDITDKKHFIKQINELNTNLEEKVKKRTSELELANLKLKRINKAFVGRELNMVELKKEIENLKKKNE